MHLNIFHHSRILIFNYSTRASFHWSYSVEPAALGLCFVICGFLFLKFSIVPIPSSNEEIRLVDDAFGKICHMVSDGSWVVRVQAAKLLVSSTFFSEHVAC